MKLLLDENLSPAHAIDSVAFGHNPLASDLFRPTFPTMTRVQEIRDRANALSLCERAELAADLLEGLPPILDDDDEGIAEARRRDEEMGRDPQATMTWDELRRGLGR